MTWEFESVFGATRTPPFIRLGKGTFRVRLFEASSKRHFLGDVSVEYPTRDFLIN